MRPTHGDVAAGEPNNGAWEENDFLIEAHGGGGRDR